MLNVETECFFLVCSCVVAVKENKSVRTASILANSLCKTLELSREQYMALEKAGKLTTAETGQGEVKTALKKRLDQQAKDNEANHLKLLQTLKGMGGGGSSKQISGQNTAPPKALPKAGPKGTLTPGSGPPKKGPAPRGTAKGPPKVQPKGRGPQPARGTPPKGPPKGKPRGPPPARGTPPRGPLKKTPPSSKVKVVPVPAEIKDTSTGVNL